MSFCTPLGVVLESVFQFCSGAWLEAQAWVSAALDAECVKLCGAAVCEQNERGANAACVTKSNGAKLVLF